MRAGTGLGALSEQFRRFAAGARHDGATRYARICQGAATDGALLELAAEAPPDQRRPNILLAAVHFLLLSGLDDPLAAFYPTVLAWRGVDPAGPARPVAEDPFPPFAAFCARHRESIAQLVATRATQTNEVGRCTAIFPALSTVASRAEAPLAVVDLGAAAGLNLLFDRYAYVYTYDFGPGYADDAGDRSRVVGDAGSPVLLHCQVRGPDRREAEVRGDGNRRERPPTALPTIAARVGLDRRPVELRDDDQVLWLLACQWPDHLDRFDTARRSLALARSVPDPPVVRRGDAIGDLGSVVAALPDDAHVCVLHTWVAAYLTPDEQRALCDSVNDVASTRPVSWLFAETPYEVPGLPVPPPEGERVLAATAVVLVELAPGSNLVAHRLADMHSHGRWLYWYGADS